jgi:hypothetical protein
MNSLKHFIAFFAVVAMVVCSHSSKAQNQTSGKLPYIIEGQDTVPVVNLPPVDITDFGNKYMNDLQTYYRLRFNVIKVYPYAKLAAMKINELNDELAKLPNDKARRRYTKEFEKQLRADFAKQIENLSVNQGKIFIKLIDRETGHTSYELIKEVKGSFDAFIFQTAARIFGHNLKNTYDPEGDDKVVENIIHQIESGQIN